jgi:predicted enzyme related to lactoylglutathione lyase
MPLIPTLEIGIDSCDPESLAPFWAAALDYAIGGFDAEGVYLFLVPPSTERPIVYLQRVAEPKSAKNRVHLDLLVDDLDSEVARLSGLGASTLGERKSLIGGATWQVMTDPEGNEFCVCIH